MDTLLVSNPNGQAITDHGEAERIVKLLTDKYKCENVRIQVIDTEAVMTAASFAQQSIGR
jgi:hypothetical protein